MTIDKYLRTPIKIEKLIEFSQNELDMYNLYATQDVNYINKNTIFFLDDLICVDDNDNEIYPEFSIDNNLQIYFQGQVVYDIICNTKHQLEPKVPDITDYIKNFNYYNEHDCFFTFN